MTTNGQDLFLNEMSFLFFSLCILSWFNYIQIMFEVHYLKKSQTIFAMIPVFASVVLFTCENIGWMFISNRFIWKVSRRTTLYFACIYKRSLFYGWSLSSLCVQTVRQRIIQQKKSNQILGIYMVSLLLIGIMQDFFRDIPVFCVGTSLCILIVYISLEKQMISMDPLTSN